MYVVVCGGGFLVKYSDQFVVFDLDGGTVSRKLISSKSKLMVRWILESVKLNCEQKVSSAISPLVLCKLVSKFHCICMITCVFDFCFALC